MPWAFKLCLAKVTGPSLIYMSVGLRVHGSCLERLPGWVFWQLLTALTKHHSPETLLVSLYNKLVSAVSHQQVSCLCVLDISAAFDTIDQCCPTFLTTRAAQDIIMKLRAAPVNSNVTTKIGMYRLSIWYPVSAGYLTIRYYSDPVK